MRTAMALAAVMIGGCSVHAEGHIQRSSTVAVRASPQAESARAGEKAKPRTAIEVSGAPELANGVRVVEDTCEQGRGEKCNGLDDDCDGRIDEGCGYGSGAIQITIHWNTGADLDLYVTSPSGETLYYDHTRGASGGYLDHDARGRCRPDDDHNRTENMFWANSSPPGGAYTVDVHYWGTCNSGAGPTEVTLSISVGGEVIGAYRHTVNPSQRLSLASFRLP